MIQSKLKECSNLNFCQQSLICLFQDEIKQTQGSESTADPSLITEVVSIERNEYGQIYVVQALERSLHFSIPSSSHDAFTSCLYPSDDKVNNVVGRQIKHAFVPNSTNYTSSDGQVAVINGSDKQPPNCSVRKCNDIVTKMFEDGLANHFKYQEKKRSGISLSSNSDCNESFNDDNNNEEWFDPDDMISGICSIAIDEVEAMSATSPNDSNVSTPSSSSSKSSRKKGRLKKKNKKKKLGKERKGSMSKVKESALPTISLGWTTNDAHQYKSNRSTIVGNIKPFLRDAGLSEELKKHLLDVIETAFKAIPEGTTCFDYDDNNESKEFKSARFQMLNEFYCLLGGKGKCDTASFRVEGITILIPLGIGPHRDFLNCARKGMSSVLQVNVRIPMNEDTIPSGRSSVLWKWLELNGYSTWFPCSIILYSRKKVSEYCEKLQEMQKFAAKSEVHRCVHWALMGRVGHEVDYLSNIWNNDSFHDNFLKKAKKKKNSLYGGRFMEITAAYDKTVSCYDGMTFIQSNVTILSLSLCLNVRHIIQ